MRYILVSIVSSLVSVATYAYLTPEPEEPVSVLVEARLEALELRVDRLRDSIEAVRYSLQSNKR